MVLFNVKILVTGGAGFIGSAVIRHILANTDDAVVNVDKLTYAGNLDSLMGSERTPRYAFEHVDICDRAQMDRVFAEHRPDRVMHLAAESHVDRSITGPAAFVETNVIGTYTLLEAARQRFVSPKPEDRQDALEKLWDAFERLKTLEPGASKRVQADALLDRVAPQGSGIREALGREAAELTSIGNSFRIRHSETTQEVLTSLDQVDYLFTRMFAFVRVILKGTGRGG